MKIKKLLYVGNALSASGKTLTHIETLSKDLRLEGYEVIITSQKRKIEHRLIDMVATFFRSKKIVDIVLIDTYSTTNFWYAVIIGRLCRWFDIPYIPILHGGNLPSRLKKNPRISKKLFSQAKMNVAPSGYLYNAFAKANFNNVTLIPNSINLEMYPFKERETFAPHLLWVRSFAEIYNPKMTVEVFYHLVKIYPKAQLTMVGPDKDGSLTLCKEYASNHKLPVTFTGKLSKKEWINLSQESDFFISTTTFDNTPVSIIEAMALGLPIISTNVGGMPYLINQNIDGVLVPQYDIHAFVKAIENLIRNPIKTRDLTLRARKKISTFHWDRVKMLWREVLS